MTDFASLQLLSFHKTRSATKELDELIRELQTASRDITLSSLQRKVIIADISRIKSIKQSIRSLEIVDEFYKVMK